MDKLLIRREAEEDIPAIRRLVFNSYADKDDEAIRREEQAVETLRDADVLSVSLVAISIPNIVGYIAASPVKIADGTGGWYGLGPVAVDPEHRNSGIGRALMSAALEALQEGGAGGVVSLGDPAFYRRFDFDHITGLYYPGAPEGDLLARHLGDNTAPQGAVAYHSAFDELI
ncbi:GNAT family N-acetyltransferase [Corynebacterium halotolerans]|uniref:GNAT family N-acetyltransferase n=1 Tax=Corynebacterium halotolerans TaxID=225326 RepID=UPI003CEBF735